jgi:hypothetical protein
MKAIVIAALITGFSISSVYASDHGDAAWQAHVGTVGTPAPCEMVMDRGGPVEVCGTIFLGHELTKEDLLAK